MISTEYDPIRSKNCWKRTKIGDKGCLVDTNLLKYGPNQLTCHFKRSINYDVTV